MQTRLTSWALVAVLVSAVALAPLSGSTLQGEDHLENIPVQGPISHDGSFVGNLTIVELTIGEAGQLLLTGVLNGTATNSTGAKRQVKHQTFTAPAKLIDAGWTTDILLLDLAPIALAPPGLQIKLAQITLDIDAVPSAGNLLATLLNYND
jgi:hypothetical protein